MLSKAGAQQDGNGKSGAQQCKPLRSADHHLPNEEEPGPKNAPLDAENPNSVWSPETDSGTVEAFKYSFLSRANGLKAADGLGRLQLGSSQFRQRLRGSKFG